MRKLWCRLLMMALALISGPIHAAQVWDTPVIRVAQAGGILKANANVAGAQVVLDGQEVGIVPVVKLVPPGSHDLQIRLSGYATFQQTINVEAGKTLTVEAKLTRDSGSLEVEVNVDGARVLVDGKEVGTSPTVVIESLKIGQHPIVVEKTGFASWQGTIEVKPGIRRKLKLTLEANSAQLKVLSEPSGAMVSIDGESVGLTPLTLNTLPAGRHAVTITLEDGSTYYESIKAKVGESLELSVDLPRRGGSLKVKSSEEGAQVFLEDSPLGSAPVKMKGDVAPGTYVVRVSAPGKADFSRTVEVRRFLTTRINAELSEEGDYQAGNEGEIKDERPVWQRWWFWVVVGGVVAAGTGGTIYLIGGDNQPIAGDVVVPLP